MSKRKQSNFSRTSFDCNKKLSFGGEGKGVDQKLENTYNCILTQQSEFSEILQI